MKIIFFGTSEFAVPILKMLIERGLSLACVVTRLDKKIGRARTLTFSPIKSIAMQAGISVLQPASITPRVIKELTSYGADIFVIASYGLILPKSALAIPTRGSLNIHPSLLPLYRGASPIQSAILSGGNTTGVSIILMDKLIDHGPIIAQESTRITRTENALDLSKRLSVIGAQLLIRTIKAYNAGKIQPQEQDHRKATYTFLLKKEDGRVNWNKTAQYIERQVLAFIPWPGTYTIWKGKRLKILKALYIPQSSKEHCGTVWNPAPLKNKQKTYNKIAVQTMKGSLLIQELQIEGGNAQNAKDFLRGHLNIINSHLI